MNFTTQAVIVFLSMGIVDWVWARYFQATANKLPVKAGFWSALIILFGAISTKSYVEDIRFLIPAALGAFVGTWFAVKYHKEEKK